MRDPEKLAENELKAIVALGVLASVAVGFQLGGLDFFVHSKGVAPAWAFAFERIGIIAVAYAFIVYIMFITIWLALRPESSWGRIMSNMAEVAFTVGAFSLAFGLVALVIRIFLTP